MPSAIHDLPLFVVSGLLLNISPGPDALYIIGRSATQGVRAGTMAALGVGAGCLVHIAAATVGMSAILERSAAAFTVLKGIGAAYLVYIGLTMLRTARPATADAAPDARTWPLRTIFAQGFLTNVLNPKVALFFLAFLPQFIDSHAAGQALAFLLLGLIFNLDGTLWNLLLAWSAARMAARVRRAAAARAWLERVLGGALVLLGLRLALSRSDGS